MKSKNGMVNIDEITKYKYDGVYMDDWPDLSDIYLIEIWVNDKKLSEEQVTEFNETQLDDFMAKYHTKILTDIVSE